MEGFPTQGSERSVLEMPAYAVPHERAVLPVTEKAKQPVMDIFYAAQRVLLDSYDPPSVLVTAEGDIICVNGRTGKYLEPSSGKANVNSAMSSITRPRALPSPIAQGGSSSAMRRTAD